MPPESTFFFEALLIQLPYDQCPVLLNPALARFFSLRGSYRTQFSSSTSLFSLLASVHLINAVMGFPHQSLPSFHQVFPSGCV